MPSVLVETGFITNKSEGDYLNSIKGKKKYQKVSLRLLLIIN